MLQRETDMANSLLFCIIHRDFYIVGALIDDIKNVLASVDLYEAIIGQVMKDKVLECH